MDLLGTHGTCVSRAEKIIAQQLFEPSNDGMLGGGVYLWAYENNINIGRAHRRAELWWKFASSRQVFVNEKDKECAVLKAEISVTEANIYLDTTTAEFQDNFYEAIKCKKVENIGAAFAWFVGEIQQLTKAEYLVIKASISGPPRAKGAELDWVQIMSKMSDIYLVKKAGLSSIKNIAMAM